MDTNNDGKISYKEYLEYCRRNSKVQEQKFNTKISKSEDGKFKTTSPGKAVISYALSEAGIAESKIESEA